MLGKVKTIICFAAKKRRIDVEVNGSVAKTYVVEGYNNSKRWEKIQVGDRIEGLEWADEDAKIIDADSKVIVLR